jgi:hypothetical protein
LSLTVANHRFGQDDLDRDRLIVADFPGVASGRYPAIWTGTGDLDRDRDRLDSDRDRLDSDGDRLDSDRDRLDSDRDSIRDSDRDRLDSDRDSIRTGTG